MTFRVLRSFEVETPDGLTVLREGQLIRLSLDEAIPLIEDGAVTPLERVAYKVYSRLLGCYLWVTERAEDVQGLRARGITDAIYTNEEVKRLTGLDRQSLKFVNSGKTIPDGGVVEAVVPQHKEDKPC